MGLLDDINAQIARGDAIINRLNASLVARESQTLLSEDPYVYNPPIVSADGIWILSQSTPNEGSLYVGKYRLVVSGSCAFPTIISHNIVTPDDNIPARYLPCGSSSLVDVSTVTALNNQCTGKLEFRSKNPFTITVKLANDCNSLPGDYRVLQHDFANGMGAWRILWVNNVKQGNLAGGGINSIVSGTIRQYQIVREVDPNWRIRSMRLIYERDNTGHTIMRYRPFPDSNTNALNPSISGGSLGDGTNEACQIAGSPGYLTGINQLFVLQNVNGTTSSLKLRKIELLYVESYAEGGYPSDDATLCTPGI